MATTSVTGQVSHLRWSPRGDQVVSSVGRPAAASCRTSPLEPDSPPMMITNTGAGFGAEWRGSQALGGGLGAGTRREDDRRRATRRPRRMRIRWDDGHLGDWSGSRSAELSLRAVRRGGTLPGVVSLETVFDERQTTMSKCADRPLRACPIWADGHDTGLSPTRSSATSASATTTRPGPMNRRRTSAMDSRCARRGGGAAGPTSESRGRSGTRAAAFPNRRHEHGAIIGAALAAGDYAGMRTPDAARPLPPRPPRTPVPVRPRPLRPPCRGPRRSANRGPLHPLGITHYDTSAAVRGDQDRPPRRHFYSRRASPSRCSSRLARMPRGSGVTPAPGRACLSAWHAPGHRMTRSSASSSSARSRRS